MNHLKEMKEVKVYYNHIFEHRSIDSKISIYLAVLFLEYLSNPLMRIILYFLQESSTLLVPESECWIVHRVIPCQLRQTAKIFPGDHLRFCWKKSWRDTLVSIKKFQTFSFQLQTVSEIWHFEICRPRPFLLPDSAKCTFYVILGCRNFIIK